MNKLLSKFVVKFCAFTLAETLIVMGIIGIVSALTLPNLNSSTGEREKIAKVKKLYQNLTDAFGRAEAVYGNFSEWFVADANETAYTKRFSERVSEFLKISKDCGSTADTCFKGSKIKSNLSSSGELNLNTIGGNYWQYYILADGSSIAINLNNTTGSTNYISGPNWMGWVAVDIDGPSKGGNVLGNDIHLFAIYPETGITVNGQGNISDSDNETENSYIAMGILSTYWITQYDNMDYLKIGSSGKCPNGKTLDLTTNTSCK